MLYRLLCNEEAKGKLFIPAGFSAGHDLIDRGPIAVRAGQRSKNVEIVKHRELNDDEILISKDVLDELSIPVDVKYQVKFVDNCVRIGPVLGLLMVRNLNNVGGRRLDRFSDYALLYSQIGGLLLVLGVESINFDDRSVEGYYYEPNTDGIGGNWRRGIFPLPDSIFERTNMPEPIRLKLKKITGNRLFNSNYFDKWEFWKMVSEFDPICDHIPHTRMLKSGDDIDYMLSHYDGAYLKPLNGTLARGLYKVIKSDNSYVIRNKQGSNIRASSKKEMEDYIRDIMKGRRYLVQQALEPIRIDGRHIDFRVIMQKDHTLKWVCPGIIAFVGNPGEICSNWGYESTFEDLFSKYFNFSQEEIFKKKQEVISICRNICEILDLSYENYGDLGFDVLIDKSLKVWVLETNKRHYHTVPLWINDVQTFYAVKSNPIKYAAAISGFDV